ncbi:MAG: SCP2 sterol-binding domain-containing protein [Gammaproteobacteria bacterium]|nr:SCP2 sterol-binding domain-containing protein [Gammaproteobacteria bacterium]
MDEIILALCATIEGAFNTLIDMDPEAKRRLSTMQGKVIAIRLKEIDLSLYLLPTDRGVQIYPHYDGEVDTEIVGTPVGLISLGLGNTDAMFEGDVEIRGDVELGQAIKRLIDKLDIDWEEQLSRVTGDTLAYTLGRMLRSGLQWGQDAIDTLGRDAVEYLQQESRDLPDRKEVDPFLNEVDRLRDDVSRLEARLQRLDRKLGDGS